MKKPRNPTSKQRRRMAYAITRLDRLRRLRAMRAPRWIVRAEQVALVLNRAGMVAPGIGGDMSLTAGALYDRYVIPCMGADHD